MIGLWLDAARRAPLGLQLLLILALSRYLCQGVYAGLFANGFDFKIVHDAAAAVAHGRGAGIYDAFLAFRPGSGSLFYMYPPPAALLFAPLGLLEHPLAFALFQVLSHALLWGFWAVCIRRWPEAERREKGLAALVVILLFSPLYLSLRIGQSEPLILFCLAAGLYGLNTGRFFVGGLLLAAAVWLKLFLGLLLIHLLLRRQYRALGYCVFWLALLFAAGGMAVPWEAQAPYWTRLAAPLGIEAFYDNQSASGFTYRWLAASPYATGWIDSPRAAAFLRAALSAVFLAGYARAALRARGEEHSGRLLTLCLVTALLVAPHADTHHQALLLAGFLSLPFSFGTAAFYAALAEFVPLVADKFISLTRLSWFAHGPANAILSLPFFVLAGFWLHLARSVEGGSPALAEKK
ncbi:MAG: glycosyltransferase family 87 protein [Elusimicrobiota bacterium]|nr:glycosyltransferase family 87 protein [Elusimicrobiota bacterium]